MAAKMPKAGRPARTAGNRQPARTPGATGHKRPVRARANADETWNATGIAAPPLPSSAGPQRRRP